MGSPPQSPAHQPTVRPNPDEPLPAESRQPSKPSAQLAPNGHISVSSTSLPTNPAAALPAAPPQRHAAFTIAFVVLAFYLGLVVVILPWRDAWTDNSLLDSYPLLRTLATNNFVRGLVSGVGVLDVWMAISEALTYRRARAANH